MSKIDVHSTRTEATGILVPNVSRQRDLQPNSVLVYDLGTTGAFLSAVEIAPICSPLEIPRLNIL